MMKCKIGRDEGGKDRRRADVLDDWDSLAQFGASEAAHREQNDRYQDIGGHFSRESESGNHREQDHENRYRNDADLVIDDRPPALGPETFGRALRSGRYALGVLQFQSPRKPPVRKGLHTSRQLFLLVRQSATPERYDQLENVRRVAGFFRVCSGPRPSAIAGSP